MDREGERSDDILDTGVQSVRAFCCDRSELRLGRLVQVWTKQAQAGDLPIENTPAAFRDEELIPDTGSENIANVHLCVLGEPGEPMLNRNFAFVAKLSILLS